VQTGLIRAAYADKNGAAVERRFVFTSSSLTASSK